MRGSFALCSRRTATAALSLSSVQTSASSSSKHVLYDMPMSNSGARCRIILYKKNIPATDVAIVRVPGLRFLKTKEFLTKVNPLGKIPALVCNETQQSLWESNTIARYFMSTYAKVGPSFQPNNPMSNHITQHHDMYLSTIQGCMYLRGTSNFGNFGTRKDAVAEYSKQLHIIEDLINDPRRSVSTAYNENGGGGIYLLGKEVSLADATLFPSCIHADFALPKFDVQEPLPPRMREWFDTVKTKDLVFGRVYNEMMDDLRKLEQHKLWDDMLGAGWRDDQDASPTMFDKIIKREIPAVIVKETRTILAFKDVSPAAPAHVVVVPKHRNCLTRLTNATVEYAEILGQLMLAAAEIAQNKELGFGDGARIVINDGPDGGQEVMHLHVHVIGGQSMQWPSNQTISQQKEEGE